ncbi:MAG: hypothetical protein R3E53_06530 [Myxococcota bacterium]
MIVCDSPISAPDPEIDAHRMGAAFGKPRIYASRREAPRALPHGPAPGALPRHVMADVGPHSLTPSEGGWRWKFDHNAFNAFEENPRAAARAYLPDVRCRPALLRSSAACGPRTSASTCTSRWAG